MALLHSDPETGPLVKDTCETMPSRRSFVWHVQSLGGRQFETGALAALVAIEGEIDMSRDLYCPNLTIASLSVFSQSPIYRFHSWTN